MDDLHYKHPLNLAHKYGREAESFERLCNFPEALKCHQKAIDSFDEAISITTFSNILQSLKLQKDFHINKKRILRLKSLHFRLHRELLEKSKRQMALEQSQACLSEKPDNNLKWTIFRHIETVDSLLSVLVGEKKSSDAATADLLSTDVGLPAYCGTKLDKDDSVVIEELHTLNTQLRKLVGQLLTELNNSQSEVKLLKEKLKNYEAMFPKPPDINASSAANDKYIFELNSLSSSTGSTGIM